MNITDPIKNALIYALLVLCLVLGAAALLAHTQLAVSRGDLATARASLTVLSQAVTTQKNEAAATLHTLNASVLAQQKTIDARYAQQEKTDVQSTQTIDGYRADLLRIRTAARGLLDAADSARRGSSGGGTDGQTATGALAGAADGAQAARLVPIAEAEQGDLEAYAADVINAAYRSCRVDAIVIRELH